DFSPDGATFRTKDVGHVATSTDKRFRPVHMTVGPEGALYVCDWYDGQVNHYRNHEGKISKDDGRLYRIGAKGGKHHQPFDLATRTTSELIELLSHGNRWYRQTAQRLLADRRDMGAALVLKQRLTNTTGQDALEYLWALNTAGGFDEAAALAGLGHTDPHVRLWTARLLGDARKIGDGRVSKRLADVAASEPNVEVRSQLAATAKRLPAAEALPIIRGLIGHDADADDRYLPLQIWWALEAATSRDPDAVLALFADAELWKSKLVDRHLAERMMRRLAVTGKHDDLRRCAKLFEAAPTDASVSRLLLGFETAYKGRPMTGLPDELSQALAKVAGGSLVLRLRRGDDAAVADALRKIADDKQKADHRIELIGVFGELRRNESVPVMLEIAVQEKCPDMVKVAALAALAGYKDGTIAPAVLALVGKASQSVRDVGLGLLASRREWAAQLLKQVEAGTLQKTVITAEVVAQIRLHEDKALNAMLQAWSGPASGDGEKEIKRLADVLASGAGDPKGGKVLYTQVCAACHTLFTEGGKIGPDLTAFQRNDLPTMLLSIIRPSAEIREGYESVAVSAKDGQLLSGFLEEETKEVVRVRGLDGAVRTLKRADVAKIQPVGRSLMPEGLLRALDDKQIRNLFAYLRSTQPLN
ncbi:MAG: putative heme-binding domain-containing protein, partial [Rhodothermales bacterium]